MVRPYRGVVTDYRGIQLNRQGRATAGLDWSWNKRPSSIDKFTNCSGERPLSQRIKELIGGRVYQNNKILKIAKSMDHITVTRVVTQVDDVDHDARRDSANDEEK